MTVGMQVTRYRANRTLTISPIDYTRSVLKRTDWGSAKPVNTPGAGREPSLDQPEGNHINDTENQRYQAITSSLMYLVQLTRYDILFKVSQLAGAMSKPSNVHMGAAKHILRYLASPINFDIAYKKRVLPQPRFGMLTGATTRTRASRCHRISC